MEFRNLSTVSTSEIVDCLHRSFSDYFVPVKAPVAFWEARWQRGRVDYALSFGAFFNGTLIGFILNGVDEGTAFNLVSGVVPEHRGHRIIKRLYQYALPLLAQHGVRKCALEVITKNEKAIKAYSSAGFTIAKEYKCYFGTLTPQGEGARRYTFQKAGPVDWERYKPLRAYALSWEHSDAALDRLFDGFECWELVAAEGALAAYIVINPQTGFIAQLGAVRDAHREGLEELLNRVAKNITATVKINNVAATAAATIAVLERAGLQNYLDQYEMELRLPAVSQAPAGTASGGQLLNQGKA